MKSFFGKLAAFFRKTWVWSLCLVLVLALLVWFAGPLLAVNDYKFWESATSRLLTISGLFLLWGLAMVFASWRASARKKAEENDAEAQERLRREEQISEEQAELRHRLATIPVVAADAPPLSGRIHSLESGGMVDGPGGHVGVDGKLAARHPVQRETGPDFGHAARALGDDNEVYDQQDTEDHDAQ